MRGEVGTEGDHKPVRGRHACTCTLYIHVYTCIYMYSIVQSWRSTWQPSKPRMCPNSAIYRVNDEVACSMVISVYPRMCWQQHIHQSAAVRLKSKSKCLCTVY